MASIPEPTTSTPVIYNATFLKIWFGVFIAAVSTFLLLMTTSAAVYSSTNSALLSNGVVLTQWLPAVVALPIIKAVVTRYTAKHLLLLSEIGCAALVLVLAMVGETLAPMFLILLLRGTLENLSKVSRTVALKHYFKGNILDRATSYYTTAMLAGGAIGALIGAALIGKLPLATIIISCGLLNLVAAGIYLSLPQAQLAPQQEGPGHTSEPAPFSGTLRSALLYYVAAVALFQGFHNVARSVYPIDHLGMGEAGIPLIQMITNVAYIVGAFAAARFIISASNYRIRGAVSHVLALISLVALPWFVQPITGLPIYALFAFFFEFAFCIHLRLIVTTAPGDGFARLMANLNAWSMGLMVLLSLIGSYAVDNIGLLPVALAFVVIAVLVLLSALQMQRYSAANVLSTPTE